MSQTISAKKVRVAFDVSQAGPQKAGCGYFAYSMAQELERSENLDLTLLRTFGTDWWDPANCSIEIQQPECPPPHYELGFAAQADAVRFWSHSPRSVERMLGHPHIVHSNNFFMPPVLPFTKIVYTLHDMTVFECPQYTTEENRIICARGIMQAAATADFIITNSDYTKKNFLEYFPFPEDRIVTVSLGSRFSGIASDSCSKRPQLLKSIDKFLLFVGTIEPRKNVEGLLEAFRLIVQQTDAKLVLAGKMGWMMENLSSMIESMGLTDRVIWLSYVTDDELEWLYLNTEVLIYPSFWEGFGMPVLEAMTFGAPVIVSSRTSLEEVSGGAGVKVDPKVPQHIAEAILRMLNDRDFNRHQRQLSKSQAETFTWARGADTLTDVYEQLFRECRKENQVFGRAFRHHLGERFERYREGGVELRRLLTVAKAITKSPEVRSQAIERVRELFNLAFWPN